jgi:hypothetical protein
MAEYSPEKAGVGGSTRMFMPPPTEDEPQGRWRPKTSNNFRKAALAMNMTLRGAEDRRSIK